jgi:hypothetical protein
MCEFYKMKHQKIFIFWDLYKTVLVLDLETNKRYFNDQFTDSMEHFRYSEISPNEKYMLITGESFGNQKYGFYDISNLFENGLVNITLETMLTSDFIEFMSNCYVNTNINNFHIEFDEDSNLSVFDIQPFGDKNLVETLYTPWFFTGFFDI